MHEVKKYKFGIVTICKKKKVNLIYNFFAKLKAQKAF